ncbi:unnamed protein product [marine sediment metagenome]|uniref:Uncharacterized protein n=1 Tax=marine sediment metagenome TaxID=412755 RepID=X1H633_9ZZZZ
MDKLKALSNINDLTNEVKLTKPFKGKADFLKKLGRIFDMVNRHNLMDNYNHICCAEAEMLFNKKMKEIKDLKERRL